MAGSRAFRRLPINCPTMQQVCRLFNWFGFYLIWANTHACNLRFAFTVEIEQFTDCYYIEYEKVHFARRAKAFVDRKNFYGGMLKYLQWSMNGFGLDICHLSQCNRRIQAFRSIFRFNFTLWNAFPHVLVYVSNLSSQAFFTCHMRQSMKLLLTFGKRLGQESVMFDIIWISWNCRPLLRVLRRKDQIRTKVIRLVNQQPKKLWNKNTKV